MLLLALILVGAPQPITLADALARAGRQNPELNAQRLNERVAQGGVEGARQLANPLLTASVGPDDPTLFGTLEVKLPVFGQRGAAIAAAQREVPVVRAEIAAQGLKLRGNVRRAYYVLAAAQAQVELADEALKLTGELTRMSADKFATGTAPRLELEQAKVAQLRAEQDLADRLSALATARSELARLLGEPPESELQASDRLEEIPAPPPLEQLLGRAHSHPEVQTFLRMQDAALARANVEKVAVRPLPSVSLEVERLTNPCILTQLCVAGGGGGVSLGLRAGLSFELPILSLNHGRIHQAQAQASVSAAQADAAARRLLSEIRAARARSEASAARARLATQELLPAAQRLEEMARNGYELGRAPLVTVLQAQAEVTGARSRSVDAAVEAQKAFADLEEAVGETL